MDSSVLRIVGQVAGIGGLALGVFLLLGKEILRKKVFPTLSKAHAFRLLLFLSFAAWTIALAGIVAWYFASRSTPQAGPIDSQVRLVGLDSKLGDRFPVLDVRLRNVGQSVAFLKRADLRVSKVWTLQWPGHPDAEPASRNYDVKLPLHDAPYTVPFAISQSIKPNAVDRFTITLGNDDGLGNGTIVYLLDLTLTYDEDDKQITSRPLLVLSNGSWVINGYYVPGGEYTKNAHKHNQAVIAEISRIEAMRGDGIKSLLGQLF